MKTKIVCHRLLRAASLAAAPILYLADSLLWGNRGAESLSTDVWWALLLLLLYPVPHDSLLPSAVASGLSWAAVLCLKLFSAPQEAFVCAGSLLMFVFAVYRCAGRFKDIPRLFLLSSVWPGVLDYLYLLHISAFLLIGVWMCAFRDNVSALWGLSLLLSAFYLVQYYRIIKGRTLFLSIKNENLIKQGQRASGYRMPVQYVDSGSRSAVLFNEIVKLMETKKPYLRDDFSAEELARMVHTNRLYLSKSINFHSGRNFNQLVNYYRVKYAIELLKRDSGLKMNEVAQMSGFHTVVSFNMAFKLNQHTTPSEFARSLKDNH